MCIAKRKNGHQFVDLLKRAEKRHGDAIKNIFVVLDNLSIPISKKVIEKMANMPKNKICILASDPELDLIEVEDGYGYKGRHLAIPYSMTSKK